MITTETPTAVSPLLTVTPPAPAAKLQIRLTPAQQQRVAEQKQKHSVIQMQSNEVALFGSERQVAFSQALDGLLAHITKGSSPVLFNLFRDLQTAGKNADVGKLELDIRKSLETSWFQSLCDMLKLDSVPARIARVNKRIGNALVSKTTSLLGVMKTMETGVNTELQKLIADSQKIDTLASEFIANGEEFGVTVEVGRALLAEARDHQAKLTAEAGGDMMAVQRAKDFGSKVDLFESRVLILETAYVKSFANLDAVGLAKTASVSTIAETANSVLSEFTDIKTSLVQLSIAYQIQSVQALNAARRDLRATLEKHGTAVLSNVAVTAAKMQGDNRLEDAQLLAALVTNLQQIGTSVEAEYKANQQKFADAQAKLVEAQKQLSTITKK